MGVWDISRESRYNGHIEVQIGWQPKVSFEEGVRIMSKNIDLWRDAPVWDEKSIAKATQDWFTYLGTATKEINTL